VKQALLINAHAFISNVQNLSTSPRSSVFVTDVLDNISVKKMTALFDAVDQDKMGRGRIEMKLPTGGCKLEASRAPHAVNLRQGISAPRLMQV
jgi:hypothetical protein